MGGASRMGAPIPASTISLRVKGNSMSPLILDGYLIAVDTSETAHEKMLGQIVVAWNRDEKRLLVSRLIRFDHTDALISDRRENQAVVRPNSSGALWVVCSGGQADLNNRAGKRLPNERRFALDFEISLGVAL